MALSIGGSNHLASQAGNQQALQQVYQQGSSGLRINSAADDPAGLVLSEQLRGQITGVRQAVDNSETAGAFARTAEGALAETSNLLGRARELVLANANSATLSDDQRSANDAELNNIRGSLDRISNDSQFGTQQLFADDESYNFQIGPNAGQSVSLELQSVDSEALNLADLGNADADSSDLLGRLDSAINDVASQRGRIGAFESNTIATTENSLRTTMENEIASESILRDVDFAELAARKAQEDVQNQVGIAMLAQGNQLRGNVLNLLS